MKKLLFLLVTLLFTGLATLKAQQARTVEATTPTTFFQSRLEKLYQAIEDKNEASVSRYEHDLVQTMRETIYNTPAPTTGSTEEKMLNIMNEVLAGFENFTFVNAEKAASDEHLAQLELFLGAMRQ